LKVQTKEIITKVMIFFFGKIHDILTEVRKLENYDNGKEESEEDKK